MKEKWLMAEGPWQEIKPMITTALESGFDCVLVDRENVDRVRELGKILVACFGAESGTEDILVVGKGGEGDGTVALPKDTGSSLDGSLAKAVSGTKAAYVVIANKKYEEFAVEIDRKSVV
jgi:3-dehydroquinate synthase II